MGRILSREGKVVSGAIADCKPYVQRREAFCSPLVKMMDGTKGRRVVGRHRTTPAHKLNDHFGGAYAVLSYGDHWFHYVYDYYTTRWYGNAERYSRTTTKHLSELQPVDARHITWTTNDELRNIYTDAAVKEIIRRLEASNGASHHG